MALANLVNSLKSLALSSRFNTTSVASIRAVDAIQKSFQLQPKLTAWSPFQVEQVRFVGKDNPLKYKKGIRRHCYRRWVDKPEKYTTARLNIRKLGGRNPFTGKVAVGLIGGGSKQKYRWVLFNRNVSKGSTPMVEKVHGIYYDPCRTAKIALVAHENQKRWILASVNMKAGDLIKSSSEIPRIPVKPVEGDAWPLGALPLGTVVHNVEMYPGRGGFFARAAGTCCQLLRRLKDRVIIQIPSKHEVSLSQECMAVVGRVSNPDHNKIPIGSAQRNRWLGNRPKSGLWHRKDGYCGRKLRRPPPVKVCLQPKPRPAPIYKLDI